MHGPINVKSPHNISKWHMGINSAFKGLMYRFENWTAVKQSERIDRTGIKFLSVSG
jgi:hypothetical protein